MAKVMRRLSHRGLTKTTLILEEVKDIEADNLDDLMIENEYGELVVTPNTCTPTKVESKRTKRPTGGRLYKEPHDLFPDNHICVTAELLEEWIKARGLCASEVSIENGIIRCDGTYDENLLVWG
jgi:hypothetical protein